MVFLLHPSFSIISKIQFKAIYEKYPSPHFLRIIKFPIHGVNRCREITLFAQHCILNQQTSWDFFPRAFLLNSSQHNILHQPGGIWDAAEGSIFRYPGLVSPLFVPKPGTFIQISQVLYFSITNKIPRAEWAKAGDRGLWKRCQECRGFSCGSVPTMVNLGSLCRANQVPTWCLSGAAWPPASQVMD